MSKLDDDLCAALERDVYAIHRTLARIRIAGRTGRVGIGYDKSSWEIWETENPSVITDRDRIVGRGIVP